ncbi:biotin transport system ATP-binding protein [Variovorax sp. HW608]|uniref:energy-coupling factor ABC transporter ATP-binding protein n=1 Tax=Variovorax sp. HW608 TaxID=1034889 RepID=UPI00081FE605|nr:ABC transporter ATP-binding protein [Variovorax sp. HW608]SCK17055.1 biotin transport system ATP-binding protein [Variovorax sp. HW608]
MFFSSSTEPWTPSATGIQIESVVLERGGQRVFDGLTLSLDEPRIGIIGDNGAGKSSLLRLIAGLDQPQRGHVKVHGHDARSDRSALPRKIGLMFQNPDDQVICPTVEEELAFTLSARNLSRKEARKEARAFLADRGLAHWGTRAIAELSQGQRQQVCLLALQIGRPLTLLLDEPFASLDLPSQHRLSRQIMASTQQLVFSTHVLEQVRDFERVIWLDRGQVRADGAGREVCEAYRADVMRRADACTPEMEPSLC